MWWVPQKLSQKSTSPSFCRSTEHSKNWKFTSARSPPVCVWMYTVGSSSKIHTLAWLCTLEMRVWQVTGMWDSPRNQGGIDGCHNSLQKTNRCLFCFRNIKNPVVLEIQPLLYYLPLLFFFFGENPLLLFELF